MSFVFVGIASLARRPQVHNRRRALLQDVCSLVGHQTQISLPFTGTEKDVIAVSYGTRGKTLRQILPMRISVHADRMKICAIAAFENALGRSVQPSDKPLLETMLAQLKANNYKVSTAIDLIIRSPQFREVRGRDLITAN